MNKLFELTILILLFSGMNCAFGQVELTRETSDKEKKKQEKEKKVQSDVSDMDGVTSVFFTSNWSHTSRELKPNDGFFGDSLGSRADETGLNTWSFSIGIRNQFHKNFAWEGGISYLQNGESYSFEDTDTSYSYDTHYSYIAMPIRVLYTYGDRIKLLAGGGVVPQIVMGYKKDEQWRTADNFVEKQTLKVSKDKTNSFVLSAVMNIGVQVQMGKKLSLLVMPEYKIQLTSTYLKTAAFKHYARSLGFNFGLVVQL